MGYMTKISIPSQTFRVLKEKEESKYGEYRTRRLVLEAWDRLDAEWPFAITISFRNL